MKDLVLITGASGGIGKSTAELLSSDYRVVGISRRQGPVKTYKCDLGSFINVYEVFSRIVKENGPPKYLINCAGFVEPKGILEIELEDLLDTVDTNLSGVILCTQQFVKYNRAGGKIINIASTSGQRPSPGWSVYGATKAGVINFSASMAEELKPYDIKVYCVSPGRCATDLRKKLSPEEDPKTIMQPEEVASFIKSLLEDKDLLSSQVLVIKKGG